MTSGPVFARHRSTYFAVCMSPRPITASRAPPSRTTLHSIACFSSRPARSGHSTSSFFQIWQANCETSCCAATTPIPPTTAPPDTSACAVSASSTPRTGTTCRAPIPNCCLPPLCARPLDPRDLVPFSVRDLTSPSRPRPLAAKCLLSTLGSEHAGPSRAAHALSDADQDGRMKCVVRGARHTLGRLRRSSMGWCAFGDWSRRGASSCLSEQLAAVIG